MFHGLVAAQVRVQRLDSCCQLAVNGVQVPCLALGGVVHAAPGEVTPAGRLGNRATGSAGVSKVVAEPSTMARPGQQGLNPSPWGPFVQAVTRTHLG